MGVLVDVFAVCVAVVGLFSIPALIHGWWFKAVFGLDSVVPWKQVALLSWVVGLISAGVSLVWGPALFLGWFVWSGFWVARLATALFRASRRELAARKVRREIDELGRVINGG